MSGEIVHVLVFLLPGFLTAAIFHSLTPHRKPEAFERVISALVFTIFIQFTTLITRYFVSKIIELPDLLFEIPTEIVFTLPIAIILGLLSSWLSNNDIPHKILRNPPWLRITTETSYPSEWHSIFYKHGSQAAIMLYLKQSYSLYGRLVEYPKYPKNGYFHISQAVWVTNEGEPIPLEINADAVLVPAAEVKMLALAPMIEPGRETEEKS
ncbi:MAG: hypothetical protein F4Z10_02415 [Synechococcus sp. SB0666_bin_14]|nr:hypothetical protein [Synechococcus sp. SB0666_bin_14]MYA91539.1 hypothetical protein [Synechococcus sp. SB0663_bin_10]MYG46719.1 hypothetical protein [Synechococcus sp. SB0675_bin_6]MYK91012.1 hypothetical protein [Synechococcus sp. SB0669_bin_8]